jgi:PAS domain S-box-containing protein
MVINMRDVAELKELNLLLESAPDSMIIAGSDGKILMVNEQTEIMFGFDRIEIIGKEIEILIPQKYHTGHKTAREQYVKNPVTRPMGAGLELYGIRKDGREFPVEISLSPVRIIEQNEIMVLAAIRDITQKKEAEIEIRKLNDNLERLVSELETTNKELEAFSYSVSHDLRAPLRSIDGFSKKLLKEYGELLNDEGRDYLRRVIKANKHMGHLIEDLLKLSRLSRADFHPGFTSLTDLAKSILHELKTNDPDRKAEFIIQPGMVARADKNLMTIALQNLLDNAWKYTRYVPIARIEFASQIQKDQAVYSISDNGAGFDILQADRLFKSFQRLHSNSQFEGTGIGLAIVQRIIQRHNGTIWAQSETGKGATFYFTL